MKNSGRKIGRSAAALLGLLLALALGAGATVAYADEVTGQILDSGSTGVYRYFDHPTAITADGNGFIVADGETAYSFMDNTSDFKITSGTQKLYLTDGKLLALSGGVLTIGGEQLTDKTDYADFALCGDAVFAVDGKADGNVYRIELSKGETAADQTENEKSEEQPDRGIAPILSYGSKITMIAAYGDKVYLCVPQRYMTQIIPCSFDDSENSLTVMSGASIEMGEIRQIYGAENGVVLLGRNEIATYDFTMPSKWSKAKAHSAYDTVSIFPYGQTVYAIDQLGGVYKLGEDYDERTVLLAAASDAPGYFHGLRGIATGQNMLAAADLYNNRVQILGGAQTRQISGIMRPKAVAIDSFGNIFAAHNGCEIEVYDSAALDKKYTLSSSEALKDSTVVKLATDSDDALYLLCEGGQLYKVSDTSKQAVTYERLGSDAEFTSFAIAPDNSLYAMTSDGELKKEHDGDFETILKTKEGVVDFCVDHDSAVYMLTRGGVIYKSAKPYTSTATYTISEIEGGHEILAAGAIVMNTVISDSLKYGDLIVTDVAAEAVIVVGKDRLNVNAGFKVNDKAPEVPEYSEEGSDKLCIYTLTGSCEVYYQAAQISTGVRLEKGMKVIVPHYDENANFTFVIADNPGNTEPIRGYIDTKYLSSAPLGYGDAPTEKVRVLSTNAKVYDYPTLNLPDGLVHSMPRDSILYLEPFVYTAGNYGYIDNQSGTDVNLWYKVKYVSGGEPRYGFVISDYVTERGERTVFPKYNARIIAKTEGEKYAQLYRMNDDGEMVEDTFFISTALEVGKHVEVIGRFDSSAKYTQIRCEIEGMIMNVYVETANLKYEGVDTVVIVAVILTVLTMILGAVLVWYFLKHKRTKKYEKK